MFAFSIFAVSIVAVSILAFSEVISAVTVSASISPAVTFHNVVSHITLRVPSIVTFPPNSISVVHRHRLEKSHATVSPFDNSNVYCPSNGVLLGLVGYTATSLTSSY